MLAMGTLPYVCSIGPATKMQRPISSIPLTASLLHVLSCINIQRQSNAKPGNPSTGSRNPGTFAYLIHGNGIRNTEYGVLALSDTKHVRSREGIQIGRAHV